MSKFKRGLIFVILSLCLIFLWFCPPAKGKFYFNIILLFLSIAAFVYGYIFRNYYPIFILIPTINGFTRFSPHLYPTLSFVCMCLLLGYLTTKDKNENFKKVNIFDTVFYVVISFWLVNIISGIFHILRLLWPRIVWTVNSAGMSNIEIVFHIVGYVLFPLSCAIVVFFIVFFTDKKEEKIFLFLSIGMIISSIVGILQALEIIKGMFGFIIPWEKRVNGLFSDFNSFSLSTAITLPMFVYQFTKSQNGIYKIIYFISIVLSTFSLFLTGSRSGVLCVCIFGILYSFFYIIKMKRMLKLNQILVFAILILTVILTMGKFYPVKRIEGMFNKNPFVQINERKLYWSTGLKVFKTNILVGKGIKSVYKEFSNINPVWIASDNACNTYIQFLAEIGILGTLVFILLVISLLYHFFVLSQTKYIYFLVIISFLIVLFFGHHIEAEETNLLFWIYLGLFFAEKTSKVYRYFNITSLCLVFIFLIISFFNFFKDSNKTEIFKYSSCAGLYQKEKIGNEEVSWSDRVIIIKNINGKKIILKLNPHRIKNQKVKIYIDDKKYDEINLVAFEWSTIELQNIKNNSIIKIVVEKPFTPAGKYQRYIFPFHGKDYRTLGVLFSYNIL